MNFKSSCQCHQEGRGRSLWAELRCDDTTSSGYRFVCFPTCRCSCRRSHPPFVHQDGGKTQEEHRKWKTGSHWCFTKKYLNNSMKSPPAQLFGGSWAGSWTRCVARGVFGAMLARGAGAFWLAGSWKRTHLLYEMISKEKQNRMSPVRTHSGGGRIRGCMFDFTSTVPYLSAVNIKAPKSPSPVLYASIYMYIYIYILKYFSFFSWREASETFVSFYFLPLLQKPKRSSWKFHLSHCCADNSPKIATVWLIRGVTFSLAQLGPKQRCSDRKISSDSCGRWMDEKKGK